MKNGGVARGEVFPLGRAGRNAVRIDPSVQLQAATVRAVDPIGERVEIVENYDVDGIHIDDYFYPARDMTEDLDAFRRFPRDFHDVEDWRRDNVDILIRDAGQAIHKARPGVVWGVSPAGIWANKSSHSLGSDTRGNQCYFNLYADVRHWVKSEWIDYVTPQIYWHIGFEIAEFKTLVDWWADVAEGTDVALYIGTAAYRVSPTSKTPAWRDPQELVRQLDYMATKERVDGQIFFTAHSLAPGKPASAAIEAYSAEHWQAPEPEKAE